ncbi:DUF6339 family protein [Streptomyces flavofungini]|uniref:DUF6339 family protein n=1 Tax=Streptomyces flavofungini TaxID=68200 RepID=UPI0025AEDA02|nr:DUF6339 family protein [Streptomyces flavofungini]WJV48483.1 DUF6339 family protein [Streptomyces flavofungini]
MTSARKPELPEILGRISDSVATKVLTPSVVNDGASLPQTLLMKNADSPIDDTPRWDASEFRHLLEDTMERFDGARPATSDSWLAPRLHYTLRLTRAEATDSGLWNFIALCLAPDFVRWRWGRERGGRITVGQAARFSGRWDVQCFSRLWWAAELFRDGEDYRPVAKACSNQDILNTAIRLDLINHRPTAQAIVELLERNLIRTGRDVNGLVIAANAAAGTLVYEAIGPDEPRDYEALQDWIRAVATDPTYSRDQLPQGPVDGSVPHRSVERLTDCFRSLFETAPVRGKRAKDDEDEGKAVSP